MAENMPDIEHGEEFTSQQGREDTGAESEHVDVSEDLPMEVDANLSMQTEQKNGNETVVHLVYILKLAEMNKSTVI
jgi:hypothetical protein